MDDAGPASIILKLFLLFILILINAFFAMSEIAIISLNDAKMEKMAEDGDKKAKQVLKLTKNSSNFLSTIQIGVTLAGFLTSAVAAQNFAVMLTDALAKTSVVKVIPVGAISVISTILITLVMSYFSLVLGELAPKKFAMQKSEKISFAVTPILLGFSKLTKPFVKLLSASTNLIVRMFGLDPNADEETVTEEEIRMMVDVGQEKGVIEDSQKEMINNVFEFDDIVVSDVMTHRTEIVAVEVEEPISSVIHTVIQEGYSRMPVYQGNIDNIVGILMAKDLLCLAGQDNLEHYHIRHFMREVVFVPETAKCKHVLQEMALKKSQLAVVVDEYGGTAGIVSMEDILEEIVGNIQDEYDEEEIEMRKVSDAVYIIKGTADPDDILPQLGITLPEGREFDTMSGFVVELLGRIPEAEETPSVQYESVLFTVLLIEDNWVSKIKAQILQPEPQKEEGMEKHGEEGK